MSERKWELVAFVNNPVQAEILKGLLEAHDIMVHIVREGYQAAFGIGSQPSVRIEILVPNHQAEEARKIVEDYNAGKFEEE
ncbi:MAG: DUF2007 domain-containing protein [Anaerolineales bacterium]|nr:DUF2007 domain-containing protein [Anaerolineales bacterium]